MMRYGGQEERKGRKDIEDNMNNLGQWVLV